MKETNGHREESLPPILWEDGMFLLPHHFQYQEDRFERMLRGLPGSSRYGVEVVESDEDVLRKQGIYRLKTGAVTFEDGQHVMIPHNADPPAEGCVISPDRVKSEGGIEVLLGIPERGGGRDSLARFRVDAIELADDTTAGGSTEVLSVRRVQTRLFLRGADTAGYLTAPIDRVVLDEEAIENHGREELISDPDYMPPATHARRRGRIWTAFHRAARRLEAVCIRQANLLDSRLGNRRSFNADEFHELAKIQHLSRELAGLRCDLRTDEIRVTTLVKDLMRIAGGLAPFAEQAARFLPVLSDPEKLPPYDPADPRSCVGPLLDFLREIVALVFPADHPSFPFELDNSDQIWKVDVKSDWILDGRYKFYIRIVTDDRAGIDGDTLRQQLNVGSPRTVLKMQFRAMSALNLVTVGPTLPPGLPPGPRFHYFIVERTSRFWDAVVRERQLAARVLGKVEVHFQGLSLWVVEPAQYKETGEETGKETGDESGEGKEVASA